MSSVKTQSRYDASRHMNFISTAPYHENFWAYTYTGPSPSNSFTGVGSLALVKRNGVATVATDCPAGRILRANGKKLYLDAAAVPAISPWNDRTPLVGVFDYSTGLSGFIDPNQTMFAIYNVDKPVDATDEESSKGRNTHKGMSVYTGGSVTAGSGINVTGNTVLTPVPITLTAGAFSYNFVTNTGTVYTTSLLGAGAAVTFTASAVPAAGTLIYLRILGNASGTNAITLSTGFKSASLSTALAIPGANQYMTLTFVSDGTNLIESSARVTTTA
jgi:hypothetical protein